MAVMKVSVSKVEVPMIPKYSMTEREDTEDLQYSYSSVITFISALASDTSKSYIFP